MNIAERIKKVGFKRWHERTLMEGHAYLVGSVLSMIVTFGGMEMVISRGGVGPVFGGFLTTGIGMAIGAVTLQRYARKLTLAQSMGDRATCKKCNVYGAFNVVSQGVLNHDGTQWMRVRCRKCNNEWSI